jgi:opacity protein-like surface antigen
MRRVTAIALSLAALASTAVAQDASTKVTDGGIKVAGWMARVDASGENGTLTEKDAKFENMGAGGMHVTTGPAITYYNMANTASGNYTVSATFTESKFQGLNNHPHPYGIMIGGNDLGTPNATMLYCSAYGTGNYLVRGFNATAQRGVFTLAGRTPHEAVNKAAGVGQSVTNKVALKVSADKVECLVNDKVVGSYAKADVIGPSKLKSTDGVYGIRFGHNTEAHISGFAMTKQ